MNIDCQLNTLGLNKYGDGTFNLWENQKIHTKLNETKCRIIL